MKYMINQTNRTVSGAHKTRVLQQLRSLGVSRLGLLKMESRYLPKIIHADEQITGVVYGRNFDGSAVLVATDKRVIFLDNKPLFVKEIEIAYEIVGGVSYSNVGLYSLVTLHTKMGNYTLRTFNQKSAGHFVKYIELRCLEREEMVGSEQALVQQLSTTLKSKYQKGGLPWHSLGKMALLQF